MTGNEQPLTATEILRRREAYHAPSLMSPAMAEATRQFYAELFAMLENDEAVERQTLKPWNHTQPCVI